MVSPGEAAEWSLFPSLGAKAIYNSNLLLTTLSHDGTYGYWITPATEIAGKTERLEVSSRIAADFVGYFGGEDRQITNAYAPLSMRYQTEKDIVGFTGGFIRDNTLLGELQETGVVLQFTQRNQWSANPMWTRKLTEKLSLQSGIQFSDTAYEGDRLVGYRVVGGSGGLLYQLSERDQLQLTGSYVDFRTANPVFPVRASYPGIIMSLTHAFSESLTGTVYGGPRFLSSSSPSPLGDITADDTVWLGGASMAKRFERASLQVSFSRDLVPSGFGLLLQTDRGAFSASYALSETLACSLNVDGILTSGKTNAVIGGVFADRSYVSVTPTISWKFLEWWQAELSYTHRWREIDASAGSTNAGSAQSHATMITVTYYPPKFSWSY